MSDDLGKFWQLEPWCQVERGQRTKFTEDPKAQARVKVSSQRPGGAGPVWVGVTPTLEGGVVLQALAGSSARMCAQPPLLVGVWRFWGAVEPAPPGLRRAGNGTSGSPKPFPNGVFAASWAAACGQSKQEETTVGRAGPPFVWRRN